jgi:hypothetical protein
MSRIMWPRCTEWGTSRTITSAFPHALRSPLLVYAGGAGGLARPHATPVRGEANGKAAERPIRPSQAGGGGALLLMSRMPDLDWSTLGPLYSRTSDQLSDQAQQFFFLASTSRNKKGFDLNISDLAISYCTTS